MTKLIDCTNALGVDLMYDRMTELGVPYPGVKFRCSPEFHKVLVRIGDYLMEIGLIDDSITVLTAGCYVDKPGQHGKGNACDFDGFLTGDDEVVLYKAGVNHEVEGYRIRSMSRRLARRIECAIGLYAGVVLTEYYDSRHKGHIHFDISRFIDWRGSKSQILAVQASLKEFHNSEVAIDGIMGKQTRDNFTEFMGLEDGAQITKARWRTFLHKIARGGE